MKKLISIRISLLTETQLAELTSKLGMTQTDIITMAVNDFYDKMEEKMNTHVKLSNYLKTLSNQHYRYVGTIWGPESNIMSVADVIDFLTVHNPEYDGEMDEHPANKKNPSYQPGEPGHFYLQSDGIHYVGYLVDELVLEKI